MNNGIGIVLSASGYRVDFNLARLELFLRLAGQFYLGCEQRNLLEGSVN